MSSPDSKLRPFRAGLFLAALGLATSLAACNVRPMYGSMSAGASGSLADRMALVSVDPIPERLGQQLRNELVYVLSNAVDPDNPRYRLTVTVRRSMSRVGIVPISGTPTAEVLSVTASYRLFDASSGRELTSGDSFANASFDYSNQRYANVRAERDAEDRAAETIAHDIRTRVGAYLATAE
ncbi:MAG: LPS assembly lipoprotein LptE [Hyphomicrobiales bacterium]